MLNFNYILTLIFDWINIFTPIFFDIFIILLRCIGLIVPLLLSVAFFTVMERKFLADVQRRRGPNKQGFWGLLQAFADGAKLIIKETLVPIPGNRTMFYIGPMITLFFSIVGWGPLPIQENYSLIDINLGVMYVLSTSSLGIYGILISGWASNSKYAFLGALRSAAQMISYEISIGLILLSVVVVAGSLNLQDIVEIQEDLWFCIPLFPLWILFFIASLAETNRPPFDLPEAEAELVSGYNTEYSAVGFAMFFIGEYANILLMCTLQVILFFGGWLPPFFASWIFLSWVPGYIWFSLKLIMLTILFIWVRASFPRYRYDQLMYLGWKVLLPIAIAALIMTVVAVILFF